MGKDIPAPWQPTQNKLELAILGKLMEELGELQAIVARVLIQGINEFDPDTGESNIKVLGEEIADVSATMGALLMYYNLNEEDIMARKYKKTKHLETWHGMIK